MHIQNILAYGLVKNLDFGYLRQREPAKKIGPKIEKSLTHPNNSSCLKLDDYRSWHFLQFSMKSWMIVDDNVIEGKGWVSLQISFCTENPNKTLPKTLTLFQASSFVRFPVGFFGKSWGTWNIGWMFQIIHLTCIFGQQGRCLYQNLVLSRYF